MVKNSRAINGSWLKPRLFNSFLITKVLILGSAPSYWINKRVKLIVLASPHAVALDVGVNGELGLLPSLYKFCKHSCTRNTGQKGRGEKRWWRRRSASTIAIPYSNWWPHPTIPVIVPALALSLNEKKAQLQDAYLISILKFALLRD